MFLDTTVLVDILRGNPSVKNIIERLDDQEVPRRVGTPCVQELWKGAYLSIHPEKETQKVQELLTRVTIVPFDTVAARIAGRIQADLIRAGAPVDGADVQIAAMALKEDDRVVTRNVQHFSRIKGLQIESY